MRFTADQQQAIDHRDGNLQLIACAGSGKTEVVARRVAGLLVPRFQPRLFPRNLVAFTFTVRPGREVRQSRITIPPEGKTYLVRVVVDVLEEELVIVTAYRTSKVAKYWRKP